LVGAKKNPLPAPDDMLPGDKQIRKRAPVVAVMAAGNRDPARFGDRDRLDLTRPNSSAGRHTSVSAHRSHVSKGQVGVATLLRRLHGLALAPGSLAWRENLGLRGLFRYPSFRARPSR
jgi:cytochrome P450